MTHEIDKLYEKIDALDTAMLTTRRPDGFLVSRAMANQKHAPGADLWFVTSEDTDKLDELDFDPHVNVAYYTDRTREWISIAGTARVSRDRETVKALWAPDWKIWFPDKGDPRHGTADDPRVVLIAVEIRSAVFLEVNKPAPVVLYEMVKGWVKGEQPDLGEIHRVG
jgi:general stress protein 26